MPNTHTPTHEFLDPLSGEWVPIAAPVRAIEADPRIAFLRKHLLSGVHSAGEVARAVRAVSDASAPPNLREVARIATAAGLVRRRSARGVRYFKA